VKQFLHIGFAFYGEPKVKELETIFNLALDWLRYAPNCWIVYTSSDAQKWYSRVKPLLSENEFVFIVRIDLQERQGWLPKWAWDWIKKER
jgi:hypothetical protein